MVRSNDVQPIMKSRSIISLRAWGQHASVSRFSVDGPSILGLLEVLVSEVSSGMYFRIFGRELCFSRSPFNVHSEIVDCVNNSFLDHSTGFET